VKLGVSAPRDISIIRYELVEAQKANRDSAEIISKNAINALLEATKSK
jgi:sRNA-binding carbon storage regulator CsrA